MAKYIPIGDTKPKLLAKWIFDNRSTTYVNGTTVYDLSGNGNNLTASGVTYVDDVDLGRCAYFNGSAYFKTASPSNIPLGKKTIRITLKPSKVSTTSDYCYVMTKHGTGGKGWDINCYNGSFCFTFRGTTPFEVNVPQDTKAHQYLMTYDPTVQLKMFDNVLDTPAISKRALTEVAPDDNYIYVGCGYYAGARFVGYIQSIEIYSDVITYKNVEKTKVDDMSIGDVIPCRYTATSGQVGTFSELGTCTAPEIPIAGTTTSDGKFYLIMAGYDSQGRKKLVADRNIQTGISWDTLNSAGVCSGLPINYSFVPMMMSNSQSGFISSCSSINTNSTTWDAFKVFDNDSLTFWASGSGTLPEWLQIESPKQKSIYKYSIQARAINYHYLKTFKLQGYNSASNLWEDIDVRTGLTWSNGEIKTFYCNMNNAKEYYKFRIYITESQSGTQAEIAQLYLYAKLGCSYLLTGGTSAADKDNEWDKIICESNLGGTITPGDNNVWNACNLGARSWTSTTSTASNVKVIRGGLINSSSGTTVDSWNIDASGNNSARGFRPVILVEDTSAPVVTVVTRFMLQQGTNIFDINPANYSTPPTNISELHVVEPLTDTIIEQSGGGWDDVVNYLSLFKGTKYKILKFVRNE